MGNETSSNMLLELQREAALTKEQFFAFQNCKGLPNTLLSIVRDIEHCKRRWKSYYIAVWGFPMHYLDPCWIEKGQGDRDVSWGLPAAKLGNVKYTPNELKSYLTDLDGEIHASQMLRIFTLLERYFIHYYELTNSQEPKKPVVKLRRFFKASLLGFLIRIDRLDAKIDLSRFEELRSYLEKEGLAETDDLNRLELGKTTRNIIVHGRGQIDEKWRRDYKRVYGKDGPAVGERVPLEFHELEEGTDIMTRLVQKSLDNFPGELRAVN